MRAENVKSPRHKNNTPSPFSFNSSTARFEEKKDRTPIEHHIWHKTMMERLKKNP